MAKPISERTQKHRDALRQSGLRPIQIWVPDTQWPDFSEVAQRQSRAIQGDQTENDMLDWIDSVIDTEDWK